MGADITQSLSVNRGTHCPDGGCFLVGWFTKESAGRTDGVAACVLFEVKMLI